MRPADVKVVAEIERSNYRFPWTIGVVRDCLLAGYRGQVLELDGVINGYSIMSVSGLEAHLLNLCVHPSSQRLGYGRCLLNAALLRAEELSVEQVFLEVRPSNYAAIALYRSSGFRQIGTRPSYYQSDGGREDAAIFAATINQSH
jgi:ribosomal-protein-alanine N-acetyltransferase